MSLPGHGSLPDHLVSFSTHSKPHVQPGNDGSPSLVSLELLCSLVYTYILSDQQGYVEIYQCPIWLSHSLVLPAKFLVSMQVCRLLQPDYKHSPVMVVFPICLPLRLLLLQKCSGVWDFSLFWSKSISPLHPVFSWLALLRWNYSTYWSVCWEHVMSMWWGSLSVMHILPLPLPVLQFFLSRCFLGCCMPLVDFLSPKMLFDSVSSRSVGFGEEFLSSLLNHSRGLIGSFDFWFISSLT